MTPTDPAILLVVPLAVLGMVLLAAPLENTERGRRLVERIERWIVR